MTTTITPPSRRTRNRVIVAVAFAVAALVFILGGIGIGFVPGMVPHVLAGSHEGHHPLRVAGCLIAGAVFAIAAAFALKGGGPAADPE